MPRLARVLIDGMPHHITQRGNRRQKTFFHESDYTAYKQYLRKWCRKFSVEVWAYCLMPNHVHLIVSADNADAIRVVFRETHRRYSSRINLREGWRGYLWQGRFASFVMDERYTVACAKYIELNPVRAGLVRTPQEYLWSSARAHIYGDNDRLLDKDPLKSWIPNWADFLGTGTIGDEREVIEKHQRTGRPLGSELFVRFLEKTTGRRLLPQKRGRKRQKKGTHY